MNPSFVVLDVAVAVSVFVGAVFLAIVVEVLVEVDVVGSDWEMQTVGVRQRWVVPGVERYLPVEMIDFSITMRQTLQIVPS